LFEMPGKGFNFQDVTLLFERAGVGMFACFTDCKNGRSI